MGWRIPQTGTADKGSIMAWFISSLLANLGNLGFRVQGLGLRELRGIYPFSYYSVLVRGPDLDGNYRR